MFQTLYINPGGRNGVYRLDDDPDQQSQGPIYRKGDALVFDWTSGYIIQKEDDSGLWLRKPGVEEDPKLYHVNHRWFKYGYSIEDGKKPIFLEKDRLENKDIGQEIWFFSTMPMQDIPITLKWPE